MLKIDNRKESGGRVCPALGVMSRTTATLAKAPMGKETPKQQATQGTPQPPTPPAESPDKAHGKALWALFTRLVDEQIGGDKHHGWVADDSMAVIEPLVAEDAVLTGGDATKFTMSDACLKLVRLLVNSSQFRQNLERKGKLIKSETKRGNSLDKLEKEFESKE